MKRIVGLATVTTMVVAMALLLTPPAKAAAPQLSVRLENYPSSIKPGGTYTVTTKVNKPDNLELSSKGAEVRVYYYKYPYTYEGQETAVCFTKGDLAFEGSNYDGWWEDRVYKGFIMTSGTTTDTYSIETHVVDKPRDDSEMKFTFKELPTGGEVTIKAKLRIRAEGISKVSGIKEAQASSGTITFADGNKYSISVNEYGYVQGLSDATLEKNYEGKWQLDIEDTRKITVKSAGGGGGAIPLPFAAKVGIGIVVAVIIIGIAVSKMSGGAEEEVPV